MGKKYRSGTISVDVDIEAWQVIEQISDDDLLDEIATRKLGGAVGTYCPLAVPPDGDGPTVFRGWAEELRDAARAGDWSHFEILLLRMAPVSAREKAGVK